MPNGRSYHEGVKFLLSSLACMMIVAAQSAPPAPKPVDRPAKPAVTATPAPSAPVSATPASPAPATAASAAPATPAPAQMSLSSAATPSILQVHTVYLLTMGSRLDQYLAMEIARSGVFQVTTDPQAADAVFSDEVGPPFEKRFTEIYEPHLAPPPPAKDEEDKPLEQRSSMDMSGAALPRAISRGKGNLFLVDRHTKKVIWSGYQKPNGSSSEQMNETARKMVSRIQSQIKKASAKP
jgi:hypothetical protein